MRADLRVLRLAVGDPTGVVCEKDATQISYTSYIQRGTNPTQTTTANGAQPLLPEDYAKKIWQGVTHKSAALRFMNQRRVARGVQRMPVLDTLPTAYFLSSETGLKQTTTMSWRNVFINVEELAVIVPVPEALLADLDVDLWEQFEPKITEAIGVAVDAAIFFGTGAPASWPTAIATAAIAAGNTVTQGAGVDIAADINNVMAAAEADGYGVNGFVHRQDVRAALRGLRTTTNEFVFQDGEVGAESAAFGRGMNSLEGKIFNTPARALLNGVFEAENTASANAVKMIGADWEQFVLGIRQDITMKRFDQGIIQNAAGDIVFNLMQQDLVAARFVMRLGWACPNPVNRTQSVTASRFPASVLRDAA